jgi:hypothetical protein
MTREVVKCSIQSTSEAGCASDEGSQIRPTVTVTVRGHGLRVGFLVYNLQWNTEDILFEVARLGICSVTPLPLFWHVDQGVARVAFRPATARARHLSVNVKGSTPEGFMSNTEWSVGLDCARQSDIYRRLVSETRIDPQILLRRQAN